MTLHRPAEAEVPDAAGQSATERPGPGKPGALRRAGRIAVPTLALLVAAFSARYFTLDRGSFLEEQRDVYAAHLPVLLLHIGGGVLALSLGPLQFLPRLRARRPAVHRWTGRVYVLAAALTGVGGLLIAPYGLYPPLAPLAFTLLAALVLTTTALGLHHARHARIPAHRAWMLRSYALIFAAVTFRLWLFLLTPTGLPASVVYASGAWACVAINLAAAEKLLRSGRPA
ncbi:MULTISPECIES: DUF2306 domain-containing protein [Kitasatospora]|uniref:DUF2306 domain-containing protein n=1 Tax=Kitasatospora setae (strain ATCC 33774 / DSM 43861 / JCM 3304 / KCC A-0304 / NBRC 14216 / KM-6054) TaxID=452652 RepID=E4N1H5_KITSK|nr:MULTISPECIES: DUF2306 domain-containing protein [Kitasatospora]BAJ32009.1 hypothetical protein KSE_62450 [Kitasatospora setae KM-6054]